MGYGIKIKKMKAFKIALLFAFAFSTAKAQHDHSSHSHGDEGTHTHKIEPPHGGIIKEAGKYHIEIVMDPMVVKEKLNVYILKASLKPIQVKGITGKTSIHYSNGTSTEIQLINNETDKLYANIANVSEPFTALITLTINEKEYNVNYEYKGIGK